MKVIKKKSGVSKINFLNKRKSYDRKGTAQIVLGFKQTTSITNESGCGGCGGCGH